jgi:hypothetical protein
MSANLWGDDQDSLLNRRSRERVRAHLSRGPPPGRRVTQIYLTQAKREACRYVPVLPALAQELRTHLQGCRQGYLLRATVTPSIRCALCGPWSNASPVT